jgi:hypothetical protein
MYKEFQDYGRVQDSTVQYRRYYQNNFLLESSVAVYYISVG